MPDNKNRIAAILAIMAMLCFSLVFVFLALGNLPTENRELFNTCLIALISCVSTAFGYYLGSSVGSAQKNALLAQVPPPELPWQKPANQLSSPSAAAPDAGFIRLRLLLPLMFTAALVAQLCLLCGCSTVTSTRTENQAAAGNPLAKAGKALLSTKAVIIATATSTDTLCKARQLPVYTCTKAKAAYEQSKPLYDAAVDSYLLYSQGGDPAQFEQTLARLSSIIMTMQQLAASGGGGK